MRNTPIPLQLWARSLAHLFKHCLGEAIRICGEKLDEESTKRMNLPAGAIGVSCDYGFPNLYDSILGAQEPMYADEQYHEVELARYEPKVFAVDPHTGDCYMAEYNGSLNMFSNGNFRMFPQFIGPILEDLFDLGKQKYGTDSLSKDFREIEKQYYKKYDDIISAMINGRYLLKFVPACHFRI